MHTPPAAGSTASCKLSDWARFNDARVLQWTRLMVDALHANASQGSCQRTFMRLNNALLVNARLADHGVDRSALARLMDVHGFDSNFGFDTEDGGSLAFDTAVDGYDTRRYAIDWLNYFAGLTLLRSLDPHKPLFDAEMHIFSATKWRRRVVDAAGARAVRLKVLLARVLGQAGHFVWLWARNRQGNAVDDACRHTFSAHCAVQARWFAVSLLTQPRAFDAYARAVLDAHSHQDVLMRLAHVVPRVWLLHSQVSERLSTLQSRTTLALIEPLAFLGVSVGYIDADDPDIESSLPRRVRRGDWLFIPGCTHVHQAALRAVGEHARSSVDGAHGSRVVVVTLEGSPDSYAEGILAHDVTGVPHDVTGQPPLRTMGASSTAGQTAQMLARLEALLRPDGGGGLAARLRLVRCVDAARAQPTTADGVFCRSVTVDDRDTAESLHANMRHVNVDPDDKPLVLFVANLRSVAARVSLWIAPSDDSGEAPLVQPSGAFDVWRQEIVNDGGQLELSSGDARLLVLRVRPFVAMPIQPPPAHSPGPLSPPGLSYSPASRSPPPLGCPPSSRPPMVLSSLAAAAPPLERVRPPIALSPAAAPPPFERARPSGWGRELPSPPPPRPHTLAAAAPPRLSTTSGDALTMAICVAGATSMLMMLARCVACCRRRTRRATSRRKKRAGRPAKKSYAPVRVQRADCDDDDDGEEPSSEESSEEESALPGVRHAHAEEEDGKWERNGRKQGHKKAYGKASDCGARTPATAQRGQASGRAAARDDHTHERASPWPPPLTPSRDDVSSKGCGDVALGCAAGASREQGAPPGETRRATAHASGGRGAPVSVPPAAMMSGPAVGLAGDEPRPRLLPRAGDRVVVIRSREHAANAGLQGTLQETDRSSRPYKVLLDGGAGTFWFYEGEVERVVGDQTQGGSNDTRQQSLHGQHQDRRPGPSESVTAIPKRQQKRKTKAKEDAARPHTEARASGDASINLVYL